MKKVTPFNPLNVQSAIVQKVQTVEQFEGLVAWLSDKSDKAQSERKAGYEKHAPQLHGALKKQAFISAVAGDFLQAWLRQTNAACLDLLEVHREEQMEQEQNALNQQKVQQFKGLMEQFLEVVHADVFEKTLVHAKVQAPQVERLMRALEEEKDITVAMFGVLKQDEQQQWEQKFEQWRQSNAARVLVRRNDTDSFTPSTVSMHEFEPLIEYICTNLGCTVKAELVGKFEMYIKSGHALSDLITREQSDTSSALVQLQKVYDAFSRGHNNVTPGELRDALDGRFKEVFEPMKLVVHGHDKQSRYIQSHQYDLERVQGVESSNKAIAPAEYVDGFCISKDKGAVYVLMATSNEFLDFQDYWVKHFQAANNRVEQLKKDGSLKADAQLHFMVSAPALIAGKGVSGQEAGAKLMNFFKNSLHSHVQQAFNCVPLMYRMLHMDEECVQAKLWKNVQLSLFGASGSKWQEQMQWVGAAPGQEQPRLMCTLQKQLTEVFEVLVQYRKNKEPMSLSSGSAPGDKLFFATKMAYDSALKLLENTYWDNPTMMRSANWSPLSVQELRQTNKKMQKSLNAFASTCLVEGSTEYNKSIQMVKRLQGHYRELGKYEKMCTTKAAKM